MNEERQEPTPQPCAAQAENQESPGESRAELAAEPAEFQAAEAPEAQATKEAPEARSVGFVGSEVRAIAVALMGWLVPGLGHALLKMWGRAMAIFLAVGLLVYLGAGMRGNIFSPGGDDAFARPGYAADPGTGPFLT